VFFKLTNLNFDPFVMPDKTVEKRYFVGKSTASTLNFAAVFAQAARIYKNIDVQLGNSLLAASEKAWSWALAHPDIEFRNPADVKTGEYGDADFRGEFFWAASELYVTTANPIYQKAIQQYTTPFAFILGNNWNSFLPNLGYFTLLSSQSKISEIEKGRIRNQVIKIADSLVNRIQLIPYRIPIENFTWGSNSDILDAGMIFAMAYKYSNDIRFLHAAFETTDYIFGKNATSYCFVTGFGSKFSMHPHHRLSVSDNIEEPIPGFLVGGPNGGKQDVPSFPEGLNYKYNEPARSYLDDQHSFASNEVAINWNAPLVFMTVFFENTMNVH
jgi:endoglucanase